MLEKIVELLDKARANVANHLHVAEALHAVAVEVEAIKAHLVGLGHEATGATAVEVASLGAIVESHNAQALDAYSRIASRVAALESTKSVPAVPVVPVIADAADVQNQQS